MEGRSTNAVLRHHQLRHVPFLGETRTVGAARARQVQTQRSAHRGLALLVSWDFHIPLFSQIYQGNQNDSLTFSRVLDDLVARYRMFREKCHSITLVFDKGNNSEENFQHLEGSPYHFIGSLVPTQHQDLLNILLEQFRSLEDSRFAGVRVYRTQKEVFGEKRTIVITRSRALLRGQIRGIRQHLAKKLRALRDLEKRISRSHEPGWKGKPYTPESIQKNLDTIISGQYVADFLWGKVTRRVLGKRILFTDRTDLTDEEIIFGYRGQHHVERAFRDMKDPYFISFSPPHRWTDHMLRVHAFYCVLARTLVSLLHRRVHQAGVQVTQSRLVEQLKQIKEITNYYPAYSTDKPHLGGRPRAEHAMTHLDPQQERIFRALKLDRFLAS